jgi:ABC-type multidrug transport system fused ATPase/permease subunit
LIRGDLSFDLALAVLMLTPEFFAPLRRLAIEYHAGQEGNAVLERIAELNALPTHQVVVPVASESIAVQLNSAGFKNLELSSIGYTYPGADLPALEDVSLKIEQGEILALIGPSGAGKSTVAKLLMQFMQPDHGQILANGIPIQSIEPRDWRRIISWVPQQPALFAGTVAENIALGNPKASVAEIVDAARVAFADEFIDALPEGLNTVLGEKGLRLSGGQRQRLAIARAALMDTPLVLLDEFTAHLDEETEALVVSAMGSLMQGRTALVIAHRAATIASADRVINFELGRLIEARR